jgi:hypothetical protein
MVHLYPEVEWSGFGMSFENQTNLSGFGMVTTSLDHFIKKENIFDV